MVATGHDVRKRHDPLWTDAILAKFLYENIKDCVKRETESSQSIVGKQFEEDGREVPARARVEGRFESLR